MIMILGCSGTQNRRQIAPTLTTPSENAIVGTEAALTLRNSAEIMILGPESCSGLHSDRSQRRTESG